MANGWLGFTSTTVALPLAIATCSAQSAGSSSRGSACSGSALLDVRHGTMPGLSWLLAGGDGGVLARLAACLGGSASTGPAAPLLVRWAAGGCAGPA